jgi:hypothetical protein
MNVIETGRGKEGLMTFQVEVTEAEGTICLRHGFRLLAEEMLPGKLLVLPPSSDIIPDGAKVWELSDEEADGVMQYAMLNIIEEALNRKEQEMNDESNGDRSIALEE